MSEQTQVPSERDVDEFWQKLEEWRQTLPESEQYQIADMVVTAGKEQLTDEEKKALEEDASGQAPTEAQALTEEEVKALVEELNRFHDTLPEGQHQILDAIVGKACMTEQDVQAHGWVNVWPNAWARTSEVQRYFNICRSGGGYPNFGRQVRYGSTLWTQVGCWYYQW